MRYKEFSETLKSIDVKNIDLQIKKTFKYMFLNCYKNIKMFFYIYELH